MRSSVLIPWLPNPQSGFVIATSRRSITFLDQSGVEHRGTAVTNALDITVGDVVHFLTDKDGILITEICERQNFLTRSYGKQTRRIAANLDRLYVVTAIGPLLNTSSIDRMSCAAAHQGIPVTLIVNKTDLALDATTQERITTYENIGYEVLLTSTKTENGLSTLLQQLAQPELTVVCFAGVSGVGKSSILNRLVPEAKRTVRNVSARTGQGTQTTSQAVAYEFVRQGSTPVFLIDLPGVQNFGITSLTVREVQAGMYDIAKLGRECEFADCLHTAEPNCAVKSALESGLMAPSRYESYCGMLDEIERMREY